MLAEVTEEFAPDWTLKRYTFDGLVGGIRQKIEASVEDDKVHMQFSAERANPQRIVELHPNTVILDNFVPTNFQVLLNRYGTSVTAQDFYLLVPQKLMALKGTLARAGSDAAILNGKKIQAVFGVFTKRLACGTGARDRRPPGRIYRSCSGVSCTFSRPRRTQARLLRYDEGTAQGKRMR